MRALRACIATWLSSSAANSSSRRESPACPAIRSSPTLVTLTVVGVTGDVRHTSLAVPPRPEMFVNAMQADLPWPWSVLVVRAIGEPEALTAVVRDVATAADPNVPLVGTSTMDDVLARSMAGPRVYAILVGAFAALALVLSAVGLYGLIAYSVSQRTHEIGVRLALGAARGAIVGMVLKEGIGLSLAGAVAGLAGAVAATRLLAGLASGVEPNEPLTLVLMTALRLTVAVAASYLPARGAARVDPATAPRAA